MKRTVNMAGGKSIEVEVKDEVTWKEMRSIMQGLLTFDDKGKTEIDAVALADRALKVLVRPTDPKEKFDPDNMIGDDVWSLVVEGILPKLFRSTETEAGNSSTGK